MIMEHPYNLLQIVVKQHYLLRPDVLEKTNQIIADYNNDNTSYAQTLSAIYQVMSDLPSDILLYYLTTVPLPKTEEIESSDSPLPGLVKRLLVPSYHNSVRPVLLRYLNENAPEPPTITPLSNTNVDVKDDNCKNYVEIFDDITAHDKICVNPEKENVKSVIDENITQSKKKNIKSGRGRKNKIVKTYQVKSLGLLCANNIWKFFNHYFSRYTKLKIDAWKIIHDKNFANNDITIYNGIIKDSEKKLKWLNMFKTGHVPIEILEEEYGDSDIFYLERRHLLNNVTEDILELEPELLRSIDDLVDRISD